MAGASDGDQWRGQLRPVDLIGIISFGAGSGKSVRAQPLVDT
jgi:hypothetical protein